MIRNFDETQNSATFLSLIKIQSEKFLGIHEEKPRLATVFSSQDRWLMAHVGLSLHFEKIIGARRHGLSAASFVRSVTDHNVTSRNTAMAFLNEMLNYGIIDHRPHPTDRRMRIMVPASTAVEAIIGWTSLHLATLDALDRGDRTSWFHASPLTAISELQPAIAAGLLRDKTIRNPPQAFAHFMWMNSGFLITERLIASLEDGERLSERLPLRVTSAAVLTSGLNLSRSHSARKINEAERLGILGWSGTKGRSPMWLSREFVSSFCSVQAAKLEIIDQAVTRVQATPIHQIDRPQAERQPSPLN